MANELILIVEDNEKNRKLARVVLQAKGYRTLEAESAEAALVVVQETVPDLVLLDIFLPGMNGIEALKQLRERESTRAVPVLAFTASVMQKNRAEVTAAGFDGFLAKPIKLKEFEATIAAALRKSTA
jgi:two-component system cell cycle response regulator DivK